WVLAAGGAESAHANALSPASAGHLLGEARQVFDIGLVDTGPIVGSLEASVLGPAVDGVILTVSRGQTQPMVDRAIRMLQSIGANIAGLVFNRAEQRDFHRSVTSASMRSM